MANEVASKEVASKEVASNEVACQFEADGPDRVKPTSDCGMTTCGDPLIDLGMLSGLAADLPDQAALDGCRHASSAVPLRARGYLLVGIPPAGTDASIQEGIMPRLTKLDRSIAGRVAIVTGAASGMGRATAQLLADEGARVAVMDLDQEALDSLVQEIEDAGGTAHAWRLDVANGQEVSRVFADVVEQFGGIDILINNAGISQFTPVDADDYMEIWDRHLAVLLTAHVRAVRAALPWLRKSDAARIVNIASTEGLGATPMGSPYSAAKTGVTGLTRSLAVELGPEGITVNCICPGPIRTGMTQAIPDEHKTIFAKRRTALKRYGEPEEVAQITVSLCLPAASYITGAVIPVDGGLMARNA